MICWARPFVAHSYSLFVEAPKDALPENGGHFSFRGFPLQASNPTLYRPFHPAGEVGMGGDALAVELKAETLEELPIRTCPRKPVGDHQDPVASLIGLGDKLAHRGHRLVPLLRPVLAHGGDKDGSELGGLGPDVLRLLFHLLEPEAVVLIAGGAVGEQDHRLLLGFAAYLHHTFVEHLTDQGIAVEATGGVEQGPGTHPGLASMVSRVARGYR